MGDLAKREQVQPAVWLAELASRALKLPKKLREEFAGSLPDEVRGLLVQLWRQDWRLWARPEQLAPEGAWKVWVMLAGRGGGKTRPAAQQVIEWQEGSPRIALAAKDAGMIRDVMIEGDSGILSCWPKWRGKIDYNRTLLRLTFPNGASCFPVSAEAGADAARGKQFHKAWAEEVAAWPRVEEVWNEGLMNAVRLGDDAQVMVTSTPKPIPFMSDLCLGPKNRDGRRLAKQEEVGLNRGVSGEPMDRWYRWAFDVPTSDGSVFRTVVARWSTERNSANLAPGFVEGRRASYGASRFAAQELDAELFEKTGNELWSEDQLDSLRVVNVPCTLTRVVVAVDPTRSDAPQDECGIVVAGRGSDGHCYILSDQSLRASPHGWLAQALASYHQFRADALVYEKNRMGRQAELTMKITDREVKWQDVHASDGKFTRAEPVSTLYSQGKVHHVGRFDLLEDEMLTWDPSPGSRQASPNRMDALVWAVTELMLGEQRAPLILR